MDDNTGPGSAHSLTPSEPASRTLSGSNKRPSKNDDTTQNKEKLSAKDKLSVAAAGAGGGAAAPVVSSASFPSFAGLSSPAFGFGSQSAFAPSAGFSGPVTPAFGLNSPPPLSSRAAAGGGGAASFGSGASFPSFAGLSSPAAVSSFSSGILSSQAAAGGGGGSMEQISQLAIEQEEGYHSLIKLLDENKVITEDMKNAQSEFKRKEREVMACLSLLQREGPDRFTRASVAVNSVKRPVIAASWPHLKPILTGVIEDMSTDEFMRSFSWAFTEQVKGRLRTVRRGDLSDQEIQRLLTNGFDMLVQEAFSDSISIISAVPTAVNQFLFDDNPAAIGGAIAGNMLLQWAGTEVLAMLANNIIGYITFGQMSLYSVMENFRSLYSLSHQEVLTAFSNLLITVFRVPVMMVDPYIAYLKQFTLDQIRNMIATIAIASINLGYGKGLAERGINSIKGRLNIDAQAGAALLNILPDVPDPLRRIVDFSRIVLDLIRRSFIYLLNTTTSLAMDSIKAMFFTICFTRSIPGQGVFDRASAGVARASGSLGNFVVENAQALSPQTDPQKEILKFLLKCLQMNFTQDSEHNQLLYQKFKCETINRMRNILMEIQNTTGSKAYIGVFLDDEYAKFLGIVIGQVDKQLNIANFMSLCNACNFFASGLNSAALAILVRCFTPIVKAETVEFDPSEESMDLAANVLATEFKQSKSALNTGKTAVTAGVQNFSEEVLQPAIVAGGTFFSEEPRSAFDINYELGLTQALLTSVGALSVNHLDNLKKQRNFGQITEEEYTALYTEFKTPIDDFQKRLIRIISANPGKEVDSPVAGIIKFALASSSEKSPPPGNLMQGMVSSLGEFKNDLKKIAKKTIKGVSEAALVSCTTSLVKGGAKCLFDSCAEVISLGNSKSRLLFNSFKSYFRPDPAIRVDAQAFQRVVDAVPAGDDAIDEAVAAAVGADANVVDRASIESSAIAVSALDDSAERVENEGAVSGAKGDGDQPGGGGMAAQGGIVSKGDAKKHGGGRSRKRSASKRTRRRKSTTKKQKSKKNKRQSRRKARRSSSRKAGRK